MDSFLELLASTTLTFSAAHRRNPQSLATLINMQSLWKEVNFMPLWVWHTLAYNWVQILMMVAIQEIRKNCFIDMGKGRAGSSKGRIKVIGFFPNDTLFLLTILLS